MVWSVKVVDNAGLASSEAVYPNTNAGTTARYVTVEGYAPLTFNEGMN